MEWILTLDTHIHDSVDLTSSGLLIFVSVDCVAAMMWTHSFHRGERRRVLRGRYQNPLSYSRAKTELR